MSKKILMIDDSDAVRNIVSEILRDNGYEVIIAADGFQGVKFAHQEKPDLIILDLNLSAGNGRMVFKNIKMASHLSQIPFVVFTGIEDGTYRDEMLNAGVEAYLEKPVDLNKSDKLLEIIKKLLEEKKEEFKEV